MSSYNPTEADLILGGLLVAFGFGIFIYVIVCYILSAIIYYNTAKTNDLSDIAVLSWIPIVNVYVLFALGSTKESIDEIKKDTLKYTIIYAVLFILSFIPAIGFIASIGMMVMGFYFLYRLFYRWTGEQGKSILFVVISFITLSIFFFIYGLIKMKHRFVAQ